MVSKQLEEERLRNVKEGLKKKTTQLRKNAQPVRPLDTKKLFAQTTDNLKKALEVEKKAQDFEQKNNELTFARNVKLRSELNLQNE